MSPNDSTTGYSLEPYFPLDLEQEIFETAAVRDPTMIPPLLRVCRRVHSWVEPLLYRVLEIVDRNDPALSAAQIKSASFLHSAVRHVYLDIPMDLPKQLKKLLKDCTGMTDLCIGEMFQIDLFDLLGPICLRQLNVCVWGDASDRRYLLQHPFLRSITHLSLSEQSSGRCATWEEWSALATLPALTHLCLSLGFGSEALIHALRECPRLAIAVAAFGYGAKEHAKAVSFADQIATPVSDPRLVVLIVWFREQDWTDGAQGGKDSWFRAQAFIDAKRRGEIAEDCYFPEDEDECEDEDNESKEEEESEEDSEEVEEEEEAAEED
ncbi:hypothetical protein C8R47DRAFT_1210922 [Mycena vitilis]|nr:hypothetical protein C8R47DRAFT_1210922 [Mycena vitilis]